MVLGALLHVVLPIVVAGAVVLALVGRRGRRFLRILLVEQPGRRRPDPRQKRARLGATTAVALGALCAVKAAETAATSASQGWLTWTMAVLAALLVVGGGIGLRVSTRRRSPAEPTVRGPVSGSSPRTRG